MNNRLIATDLAVSQQQRCVAFEIDQVIRETPSGI